MKRAVVDVGSNSVLLSVAEWSGDRWLPILETSKVTALGEGVKQTGRLGEAPIERTLAAMGRAFASAKAAGADVQAYATMAARIAQNADDFLTAAMDQNTPVRVLSGDDEALLGFMSVALDPKLNGQDTISIIDPGGHSTELTTAHRNGTTWNRTFQKSFPVGTLGLLGGSLSIESPGPKQLMQATVEIDGLLDLGYTEGMAGRAVVLGATGTNLVTLREQMELWDPDRVHGQELDYEEVSRAVGWLAPMTVDEREALPGMEPGRGKTIHAGALILERFLYAIRAERCFVSVRGWRHAIIEDNTYWEEKPYA